MKRLRSLFASTGEPYAGADLAMALRLGSVLWLIGVVIAVALWPLSPPDRAVGDLGWLLGGLIAATGLAGGLALRSQRITWTFEMLLVASYAAVAGIAAMSWLAGGVGAPYERLILLAVLFVAAVHPPSRVAAFILFIALALTLPFAYDGWDRDAVAGSVAELIVWSALALAACMMMSGIRAQRLNMRRGEAAAREEARIDDLTKIGNRRAFEEALTDEIARAERMDVGLTVAMADIINFKAINDEWGHLEGDRVLCSVAQAIAGELRLPDRVFRWGGDEFALILPGTDAAGAAQLGERLQNKVAAACRRPDTGQIRIRFGSAEQGETMDREGLVEAADLALLAERTRS